MSIEVNLNKNSTLVLVFPVYGCRVLSTKISSLIPLRGGQEFRLHRQVDGRV